MRPDLAFKFGEEFYPGGEGSCREQLCLLDHGERGFLDARSVGEGGEGEVNSALE